MSDWPIAPSEAGALIRELVTERDALRAALKEARRAALEEAAQCLTKKKLGDHVFVIDDEHGIGWDEALGAGVTAIRALGEKE